MTLYTKSIQREITKKDGYRISIMRNPKGYENKYDEWLPALSPSLELREKTKQGCGWEYFKQAFTRELESQGEALKYVANKAKTGNVTLLCIEDDPAFCHRSLVAQEIKVRNPDLEIIIK